MKRAFDIFFSALALLLLSPWLGAIAIWVMSDSRGGAFYGQTRVGKHGRLFRLFKFRSMTADDEGPEVTLGNRDRRITKVGRVLRRYKLDELPQLWNVIRGDLSFVGPRPVTRSELFKYGRHTQAYLSVRPGVTGPWQVTGRDANSYSNRVLQDAAYVASINFAWDVKIIAQTAFVPFKLAGQ